MRKAEKDLTWTFQLKCQCHYYAECKKYHVHLLTELFGQKGANQWKHMPVILVIVCGLLGTVVSRISSNYELQCLRRLLIDLFHFYPFIHNWHLFFNSTKIY